MTIAGNSRDASTASGPRPTAEAPLRVRKPLPAPDGAPFRCNALVEAKAGPPDFGWRNCGAEATHLGGHCKPRCDEHEGSDV